MKKTKKSLLAIVALSAVCISAQFVIACGDDSPTPTKSDSEIFTSAISQLTNYSANVSYKHPSYAPFNTDVKVDNNTFHMFVHDDPLSFNSHYEVFAKEENGKLQVYENKYLNKNDNPLMSSSGWYTASKYDNPFDATKNYTCYVNMFAKLKYEDVTKNNEWYVVNATACSKYYADLNSCKIQLDGETVVKAIANIEDEHLEITYTFSNIGTTQITLPD